MTEQTKQSMDTPQGKDIVYVSWGGTGRAASLRTAMASANEDNAELVVLAILDPDAFADLDDSFGETVAQELEWLLRAQADLAKKQLGIEDLTTRVVVRRGDVSPEVIRVAKDCGAGTVLVGAPVPVSGHESVDSLLEELKSELRGNVLLLAR